MLEDEWVKLHSFRLVATRNTSGLLNKHPKLQCTTKNNNSEKKKKVFIYLATTSLKVTYSPQISSADQKEQLFTPEYITFHCLLNCRRPVSPSVHIHGCIIAGHLGSGAVRNKAWTPPL